MTGAEIKAIIEAKRNETPAKELLSMVLDNGVHVNFIGNDEFDINNIKTINGVDCIVVDTLSFGSAIHGNPKIKMEAIHPAGVVETLMFVEKDRKAEINPRDLYAY